MRLLLDTHVAIWASSDSTRLPRAIQRLIVDREHTLFVSVASIWEISIKHRIGKPSAPPFSGREAITIFSTVGYHLLDVTAEHAAAVEDIGLERGDPFDRLILAQSIIEPMRLVTHDRRLADYAPTVISF